MPSSIIGIPTSRISTMYVRQRMITQVQYDQLGMFDLQTQMSTGHRFEAPSQDPVAAQRVVSLQSLLARKDQIKTNLSTSQSYLSSTDSALGNINSLLTDARATALGVIGTTATDQQRNAAAQQIGQTLSQVINTGNQQFRGRYLFAGSETQVAPFQATSDGYVEYVGNEGRISTYGDINSLLNTNVTGSEAFGAISQQVRGIDLHPALTYDTRLADLRQGAGVSPGSIAISDGHSTSVVDLTQAQTIGDVAAMIRAHPPTDRSLEVEVTGMGLVIKLTPNPAGGFPPANDNLSVKEVGGGATAGELGILRASGVGSGPLVGDALDSAVRATTATSDLLGTRAMGFIHITGQDNDIILDAKANGTATTDNVLLNGVTIHFVGDAVAPGQETVDWNPGTPLAAGTITVHVMPGYSSAEQVVAAINKKVGMPFTARVDPVDSVRQGKGAIGTLPADVQTSGGNGSALEQGAGLQIATRGKTFAIDLSAAQTVQDLINAVNGAGAGMLAEINREGTGLDLRSRTSGTNFMIGENGGNTATQLGLRSFTDQTLLADLNFGRGVDIHSSQAGATPPTDDFSISVTDSLGVTTTHQVDLTGAETIADVCATIAAATAGRVSAQTAAFGNGIELINADPLGGTITITRDSASTAASDLGLVPAGNDTSTSTPPGIANAGVSWGADSGLQFQAKAPGYQGNVQIVFLDNPELSGGATKATAHYDSVAKQLVFQIAPQEATANDIITALQADLAANAAFSATLDPVGSTGTGLVSARIVEMTGGKPESLVGSDVHPLETDSIFNALLRLQHALENNDSAQAERAMGLLDHGVQNLNFVRAELGVRQQGIDVMQSRLESEQVDLKSAVSDLYDADFAEVVSEFTGRQVAYEAALRAAGQIFQQSLLNYL